MSSFITEGKLYYTLNIGDNPASELSFFHSHNFMTFTITFIAKPRTISKHTHITTDGKTSDTVIELLYFMNYPLAAMIWHHWYNNNFAERCSPIVASHRAENQQQLSLDSGKYLVSTTPSMNLYIISNLQAINSKISNTWT